MLEKIIGLIERFRRGVSENIIYISKNRDRVYIYTPSGELLGEKLGFENMISEDILYMYRINKDTGIKNVDYSDMPRGMKKALLNKNINPKRLLALKHSEFTAFSNDLDRERVHAAQNSKKRGTEAEKK